jgi:recombination protein RecA
MNDYTDNSDIKKYFPGIKTADEIAPVEIVPTHLPSLNDIVLGCGGIPRGRTIELYAPPSVGKTTLAINIVGDYQREGLITNWDDREGTFPGPEYTDSMNLDRKMLNMMDTASGDDALYQAMLTFALNIVDLYVIDSQAAILPDTAATVGYDQANFSQYENYAQAKMLTDFYKRLRSGYYIGPPGTMKKNGDYNKGDLIRSDKIYKIGGVLEEHLHKLQDKCTTLLMINHMKIKPGVTWGDATSVSGGEAGKFDASIRLRMTYKKQSQKKDAFGSPDFKIISIKADKNKVAPPGRSAEFKMLRSGLIVELDGSEKEVEDISGQEIDSNTVKGVKFKKK